MIVVVNIGLSNTSSLCYALKHFNYTYEFIEKEFDVDTYEKVIIPGVGNFKEAMLRLTSRGIDISLKEFAKQEKPMLGICLGMQLLATSGEEGGDSLGLDLIPGHIKKIEEKENVKLPHMGWNELIIRKPCDVVTEVLNGTDFYFIHSYEFKTKNKENVLAEVENSSFMNAVVNKNRIYGFQFHPEKSQKAGMQLLDNFLKNG